MCIQDHRIARDTRTQEYTGTPTPAGLRLVPANAGRIALVAALRIGYDAGVGINSVAGVSICVSMGGTLYPLATLNVFHPSVILLYTDFGEILRHDIVALRTTAVVEDVYVMEVFTTESPEKSVLQG